MRRACGLLVFLVLSMLVGTFDVSVAEAEVAIYIRADGTVEPATAPIQRNGDTYTFTDNIHDVILFGVERSNIIINGNGYMLQGVKREYGFYLSQVNNVSVQYVNIKDFSWSVYLDLSSNNTVSNNNITSNSEGISLVSDCYNNTFSNNNIMNNPNGVKLWHSPNNLFKNNTMACNEYNFGVEGFSVSDFIQDVDESNTVDGKPVYYWIDAQDLKVPRDAGHVTLVNCCNITVEELELTKNIDGILLVNTTNSQIKGNNITKNECGVMLYWSSNNTVSDNNITNGGVEIKASFNNTVSSNNMTDNLVGVRLSSSSSNNTFSCNNIIDNGYGIYSVSGTDNKFYHNNFINNNPHVVPSQDFSNIWDNGCEGNYWSDYSGTDSDGDGIGDTPYNINPYNMDNFPLMNRYWNPADVNHDLEVNLYDAVLVLVAYGSKQGDQNYDPHCDIAEPYGTINLYDAVSVLANYGKNIKND